MLCFGRISLLTAVAMTRVCKECGVAPAEVEQPAPPKGASTMVEEKEPEKCPNCGKVGTMEEVPEVPSGEDEEE